MNLPVFQFYENGQGGDFVRAEDAAKLQKRIAELEARLEPERQKIWVLVWRGYLGRPCSIAYDNASEATESARLFKLQPSNYVIIHTSI